MPNLIPSQNQNIEKWGNTSLTGRDITGDIKALTDITIKGLMRSVGDAGDTPTAPTTNKTLLKLLEEILAATGATPTSQIYVKSAGGVWTAVGYGGSDLNVPISIEADSVGLAKESGGNLDAILTQLDVVLSTRASEATLAAQLDITLSALRDAITDAASPKDLKDLYDELTGLFTNSDLRGSSPTYGAVSVANTATLIKAANASRKSLFIQNLGSDNLYIGNDNSVTTANAGAKIVPGAAMEFAFCTSAIYGISDGANIDTRYFEVA